MIPPSLSPQTLLGRTIRDSAIVAFRLVGAGAVFVLAAWLARRFGAAEYGAFAYVVALSSFMGLVCQFGLDFLALRQLPLHTVDNSSYPRAYYIGSLMLVGIASVGIGVLLAVGLAVARPPAIESIPLLFFPVLALGIMAAPLNAFQMAVFTAAGKAGRGYGIDRLVFAAMTFSTSFIALKFGLKSTAALITCFALANLSLLFLYTAQIYSGSIVGHLGNASGASSKVSYVELVRQAARRGLLPSIAQILDQLSPICLTIAAGMHITSTELGLMSISLSLGGVLNLTVQAVETAQLSQMSRAFSAPVLKRNEVLLQLWSRAVLIGIILTLASLAGSWLFGDHVFAFISPKFSGGTPILYWIIGAFGCRTMAIPAQDILALMGRSAKLIVVNAATIGVLFAVIGALSLRPLPIVELFFAVHVARSLLVVALARWQLSH